MRAIARLNSLAVILILLFPSLEARADTPNRATRVSERKAPVNTELLRTQTPGSKVPRRRYYAEYLLAKTEGIADTSAIVVEEGIGFGEIVVDNPRCTMAYIKSKLGQPDSETNQQLNYRAQNGMDFWMLVDNGPLREIRLNRGFRGRLSSGISMSSTMEDVFNTYGEPLEEEIVDDLIPHYEHRILYRHDTASKIFFKGDGLLFWFVGDQISQIVILAKKIGYETQFRPGLIQPQGTVKTGTLDVTVDRRNPRWGPLIRINRLRDYLKMLWIYWYFTLAALLVLGYLLRNMLRKLYYYWRPLPEGRLLTLNDPADGTTSNINIWYEARRLKKRWLTIGSGIEADIRLPHESVDRLHARISARRSEGGVTTYIEQLGNQPVTVNDACKVITPLTKNAEVHIGQFRFQYEQPSEYRQVQVRYKNGRIVEGVPTSWDINTAGFTLIPSKAPTWIDAKFIRFQKLKGVYFMRDWDEDVRKNLLRSRKDLYRHPASIRFADNEVVPGYLIGKCGQGRRFYFFPEDQSGDTVYVLVEPTSVASINVNSTS